MTEQEQAAEFIHKYQQGELTPEQELRLNEWYLLYVAQNKNELTASQIEQTVKELRRKLPLQKPVKVYRLWLGIGGIAAAAIAAITTGIWLYQIGFSDSRRELSPTHFSNDIAPGTNKATLTLADGKVINLNDAKTGIKMDTDLRYNDNTPVISNEERKLVENTDKNEMKLSTPRGGTYQITLSDGTKVWLNAASSLTYTKALNKGGQRRVKLTGEAYFEVAKVFSPQRGGRAPFIVESKGQEVEVLGTHFNINSYADEEYVKTTLLEGSVKVSHRWPVKEGQTEVVLKPNQQAVLADNSKIQVNKVDAEASIAWKNGYFLFKGEHIEPIMRRLAYWYDIEVVYVGQKPKGQFRGVISRNNNLSEVLKMMELTGAVHFEIEGRKVYVKE
ncbi:FecR family protein [Pedobacter africanus]|uniref:Ferric-dicitrate binding protein FerR (Iron transport regulator) n=1 Tax=Pedobacter africanus TaxID=151894 RepID=A0ACC6KU34_9SPHI|nr:FecR domain-containing protein [Pedobacter africanus]MDR6782654.1 ferric-dicitrate binding protein FerR (iron transport regulator) [Pedobacter africanus]